MEKVAIIGTGIAGMATGYFLRDRYEIMFYEKNNYLGGHTNTLTVEEDGENIFIDSAFMVYNEITYPNLTRLFQELDVPTKPTSMSFSVQYCPTGLEYCGTGISGLFAQRRNLFNPRFWKMLGEMDRFNKECIEVLNDRKFLSYTLNDYVHEKGLGEDFFHKFLVPMSSSVWSTPMDLMLQFPAVTLVRFFNNHGFLGLSGHYQWRTVEGGSKEYRDKILVHFKAKISLSNPARKIFREDGKAVVHDAQGKRIFDKVILACHADEALELLGDPTPMENRLLKEFRYQQNRATLHTDTSQMPKTKRAWSSWNYRMEESREGELTATTIYYMNSLQQVSKKKDYFVSINDPGRVDPSKILWEKDYDHPIYSVDAIAAQEELPQLNRNGDGTTFYCGSYFKYGFHEDALTSALEAVETMTGQMPSGYQGFKE